MQVAMDKTKIAGRVVFLALLSFFLSRVINSCLKWHEGNVGTLQKKAQANFVTYPCISLCFVPYNIKNYTMRSTNETWNFPSSALDKVIQIKQAFLKKDG